MISVSPELLAGAEDDVNALNRIHKRYWEEPRYQILKKFCANSENILSVGCGPREPILIGAKHACDITFLSKTFLEANGWNGIFTLAECIKLPYQSKFFDIVVCSEVIEHLPTREDVLRTFQEVARCGKKWIIDTPNSDIISPKAQNKHHKLFFTKKSLKELLKAVKHLDYSIYAHDHHLYVESF